MANRDLFATTLKCLALAFILGCGGLSLVAAICAASAKTRSEAVATATVERPRMPGDAYDLIVHDPTETQYTYGTDVLIKTGFYRGRVGFVTSYDATHGYTVRLIDRITLRVENSFYSVNAPSVTNLRDSDIEPMPPKEVKHE